MVLTTMFGFSGSPSVIDIIHHTPYINVKPMPVCKLVNLVLVANSHILYHGIFRDHRHAMRMHISHSKNKLIVSCKGADISSIIRSRASSWICSSFLKILFKVSRLFTPLADYIILRVSLPIVYCQCWIFKWNIISTTSQPSFFEKQFTCDF